MKVIMTKLCVVLFCTFASISYAKASQITVDTIGQVLIETGATTSQNYLQVPPEEMSLKDSVAVYERALKMLEDLDGEFDEEAQFTYAYTRCQVEVKLCYFKAVKEGRKEECKCGGGFEVKAKTEPEETPEEITPEGKEKKRTHKKRTVKRQKRSKRVNRHGVYKPRKRTKVRCYGEKQGLFGLGAWIF